MHSSNPQYCKDHNLFKLDFDLALRYCGVVALWRSVSDAMLSSNHVIAGSTRASAVVFKVSACK